MTNLALIQQTKHSLEAIKTFASQSNNEQLADHIHRLEAMLGALTAVAIGRDINIIVNQVLPQTVRQPLENVQKQWSAAHFAGIVRDLRCTL